jgi:hypothetical protein
MTQPRGLPQVLRYNDAAARLRYTLTDDQGVEVVPTTYATAALYKADGTVLAAAANMTAETPTTRGWLAYTARTADFKIGEVVTEATTGAKGTVESDIKSGTAGVLLLVDVVGTFVGPKALTGVNGGAATSSGALYSCTYYLDVATSGSTVNFAVGTGYRARIVWTTASHVYTRELYFSIAYFPAGVPLWTSAEVDERHPTWARLRKGWSDWTPGIGFAHAELVRRVEAMGERASDLVGRETELREVEDAFLAYYVADALGFPAEQRDKAKAEMEESWQSLPQLTKSTASTQTVDDLPFIHSAKLVR